MVGCSETEVITNRLGYDFTTERTTMENIKDLKFLYCEGHRESISKVEITNHTEKSVMVGRTRLPIKDLKNGAWYVSGGDRWISGTYYSIPTKELDEKFCDQMKIYKVENFLRKTNAHKLKKDQPNIFEEILKTI